MFKPNFCDNLNPAAPPDAKPIAVNRDANLIVRRAHGATISVNLSVNIRLLHSVLMQKNFLTRS